MCAGVALKVKGVVETFAAESAQVTLDIGVALHMAVEESLEAEGLRAHATHELAAVVVLHHDCKREQVVTSPLLPRQTCIIVQPTYSMAACMV